MKIFTNNKILKKIIILLLVVMSFNFIMPNCEVRAETFVESGGKLYNPIMDFLVYVGDAIMQVLQKNFISQNPVVIQGTSGEESNFDRLTLFLTILAGLITVAGFCIGIGGIVAATRVCCCC